MNIRINENVYYVVAVLALLSYLGYAKHADMQAQEAKTKACVELKKAAIAAGQPSPDCKL